MSSELFGRTAEKDEYEKVDEEVERQLDESPDKKPPRDDRARNHIDTGDGDIDGDPDTSDDDDLSMNYKDIGGSVARRYASEHPHPPQLPEPVVSDSFHQSDAELGDIVAAANKWIDEPFAEDLLESDPPTARRVAVDYAIYTVKGGSYYSHIDAPTYEMLVDALGQLRDGGQ